MTKNKIDFADALQKCEAAIQEMGLTIHYTNNFDPFFKGDLDGKRIFISSHLPAEEKLFNLLHLAGHSIQWNLDESLRNLGAELHLHPDDHLLTRLQAYEWQANCYGLSILHQVGNSGLHHWLEKQYLQDMLYLTHFYKTGKRLKQITELAKAYPFKRELSAIPIPSFTPVAAESTRNGIVIAFNS